MSLTPEDIKNLRRLLTEADRLAVDADANGYTEGALRPAVRAQRAAEIALRNAAPALLDAADALATVTRERDEARAMVTEYRTRVDGIETERVWAVDAFNRTSRDLTDLRAMYQDAQTELGRTAEAIHGEPADAHCLHEWAAEVVRERDDLRAALLNERGEGEPPSEGWAWDVDSWVCTSDDVGNVYVYHVPAGWRWAGDRIQGDHAVHGSAREAMRAVDTALAGAKS